MLLSKIEKIGKRPVFDTSVNGSQNYILENGVISHNTGPLYSSDQVFIVRKRQIKEGKEIIGWEFILDIEKSRTIREKSSIPFEVKYGEGLNRFSALLDLAIASGHVIKPKMGWYSRANVEDDKNWRRKETSSDEFWEPVLNDQTFVDAVKNMYRLDGGDPILQKKLDNLVQDEDFDPETGEIFDKE